MIFGGVRARSGAVRYSQSRCHRKKLERGPRRLFCAESDGFRPPTKISTHEPPRGHSSLSGVTGSSRMRLPVA